MSVMPRVLLVEDDERLATLTARYLEQSGYQVAVEHRGDQALARFRSAAPQLVVLDLMLPGMDGMAVCRALRQEFDGPILMLTARGGDLDQVEGLATGADDYVVKPVEPVVLLARLRALWRRFDPGSASGSPDVRVGCLQVLPSAQRVLLADVEVEVSTQEFLLLYELARQPGTVCSREALFRAIRGIDYDGLDRSIDVRISRLRRKLGDDSTPHRRIRTVWGKGYLLVPDAWQA